MRPWRYLPLLLVATLFGALAVAQRTRVLHLGYELEALRGDHSLLSYQNRQLLCEISALSHPARIADEIARSETGLLDPVRLTESSGGLGDAATAANALRR